MKALIVKFISASVFSYPERSKDKVIDYSKGGYFPRQNYPYIKVPEGTLDIRHVNNLLHVLAGERPVPSLRQSFQKHIPEITAIAETAMVKVIKIAEESKTLRKSIKDSYQTATLSYFLNGKWVQVKGGHIYYSRLKNFLGDDLFENFMAVLKQVSQNSKKEYTAKEAIELLNANNDNPIVNDFAVKCKESGKTSLYNLIAKNGNVASISIHSSPSCPLNLLTVNSDVTTVRKYSGTIYAKVDEKQLNIFQKGTGVATFLEGGYAFIIGVDDWSQELINDCVPITKGELVYVSDQNKNAN